MNNKADVSVIIPCYNCEDTIDRAVSSILEQTILPKEIILINDASLDNTQEKLKNIEKKYGSDFIKLFSLRKNSGPSLARNVGWENASFPFIAFLDSDDTWHTKKIEIQYNIMKEDITISISGHDCSTEVKNKNNISNDIHNIEKRELLLSNVLKTTSTIMVRKEIEERFKNGKNYSEDYSFILNILFNGKRVVKIDSILAFQYKEAYGEGGLSKNLWLIEEGELDGYYDLYKNNKISLSSLILIDSYSMLKYIKRVIVTMYRNSKGIFNEKK